MYYKKLFSFLVLVLLLTACIESNVYESNYDFPSHQWKPNHKPTFEIKITDTNAPYVFFLNLRHTNAYNFSNIWINMITTSPDGKKTEQRVELKLAESSGRWLGRGMNEIYEHKISLSGNAKTKFQQLGVYKIVMEPIMRQEPLQEILSVGLRIEKMPSQ